MKTLLLIILNLTLMATSVQTDDLLEGHFRYFPFNSDIFGYSLATVLGIKIAAPLKEAAA
jgi:hypothetical protein